MSGVSRIAEVFARCKTSGVPALVTYLMSGDPDHEASLAMALACIEGGADLIELGIPFSDPIADGPTIQRAADRALKSGASVKRCLKLAAELRQHTEIPVVFMGYLNPMLAYGPTFFAECRKAGVDGLIIPDLPPEEAGDWGRGALAEGVAMVSLLAPTSTPARVEAACRAATGFVYFVSVTGVTGARTVLPPDTGAQLRRIKEKSTVPVVVGFGISGPEQARALKVDVDGVVVGSAIVSRIAEEGSTAVRANRVREFVASLSAALKR